MRLSLLLTDINKSLSAWLMPVIGREREAKMINVTIDELTPCLKEVESAEQYIREMNPYESRPSIAIDLVALTGYAKTNNINLTELKESEIAMFQRKDQP